MAKQKRVVFKAEEKFRKLQALTLKAYHELNLAKSGFESTKFQVEAIKRQGHIEEIFWRFPHIGEQIFDNLKNSSLTKCRRVNKYWQNFIDGQKILYIRKIQENIFISNETLKKTLRHEPLNYMDKRAGNSL